jgi:hypothetical protein
MNSATRKLWIAFAALALSLLLLGGCSNPFAFRSDPGCFELHVKDAVELYERRKPLYSELSQGRSEVDLWILTFMQRLNVPKARSFDERAAGLRARGIEGLGCHEFVSMNDVPAFKNSLPPSSTEKPSQRDVSSLGTELSKLLKAGQYPKLVSRIDEELELLKTAPHYDCLLRHFLESIARAADLVPLYLRNIESQSIDEKTRRELVTELRQWSDDFIELHISVLGTAKFLDRRVEGLQKEGLALFCQDLPFIPKYASSTPAL